MGVTVVLSAFRDVAFAVPDEVPVVVHSHGLRDDANACEGIRAYWDADADELSVFRTDPHCARLRHSARFYGMELPCSVDELRTSGASRLARNEVPEGVCPRPILFRSGSGSEMRRWGLTGNVVFAKGRPA
jgi:branched-subunit amino acid aminotransferase/4-amino-4-deoxychorismate lyase